MQSFLVLSQFLGSALLETGHAISDSEEVFLMFFTLFLFDFY
jgi:hypothetical protein